MLLIWLVNEWVKTRNLELLNPIPVFFLPPSSYVPLVYRLIFNGKREAINDDFPPLSYFSRGSPTLQNPVAISKSLDVGSPLTKGEKAGNPFFFFFC